MSSGLSIRDVSFAYGSRPALTSVSLDVAPGAFCALLGPNGAGKSTLFALLTRLITTPAGQIEIAGHDLRAGPRKALARIGVVFQQPTLDLDLSVRQNLRYFAALQGLSGKQASARIDAALDRLSMRDRDREKIRALNGGHRRRTEIARALIHDPAVLLLDEPTVGLDAASRSAITAHIHDLAAEKALTILWATHLTDEVRPSDRLAILHRGRLIEDGIASDIAGAASLSDRFLTLTEAA